MHSRVVLDQPRKPREIGKEEVVLQIIAHARDLTAHGIADSIDAKARAFFAPELVNRARRDAHTFSGTEPHGLAARDRSRAAINRQGQLAFGRLVILAGTRELHANVPAATVDDILALRPMKMRRRPLP